MVSCLMGDSTALASAIVRCCPKLSIELFCAINTAQLTKTGQHLSVNDLDIHSLSSIIYQIDGEEFINLNLQQFAHL